MSQTSGLVRLDSMKTVALRKLRHPNHDEIRSKLGRVAEVGLMSLTEAGSELRIEMGRERPKLEQEGPTDGQRNIYEVKN